MPVAVFAWDWTHSGDSLPEEAEPFPAATRPFNPWLCCGTSFVSGCCPSYINIRVFHLTLFILVLLWRLLAGTKGGSDSVSSVRKLEPARTRSSNSSPGKHKPLFNLTYFGSVVHCIVTEKAALLGTLYCFEPSLHCIWFYICTQ